MTPGTGTLAGASIASAGTWVPSGRAVVFAALLALALELTRLAVHTPDSSARGTSVAALPLRDNVLVVMCVLSPLANQCVAAPEPCRHVLQRAFPHVVTRKRTL
jgi:hypothetical protein